MILNTRKMNDYFNSLREKHEHEEVTIILGQSIIDSEKMSMESFEKLKKIQRNDPFLEDVIVTLPKEELTNNEYYKNIIMPKVSEGGYILSRGRVMYKNKLHIYDESRYDTDNMQIKQSYFVCDKNLHCPVIYEDNSNVCWMSVEPFEINTFKKIIDEATGNVLLAGLGLGYAAYMISRKEDVKSVTVIELNESVINLFNKYLLDQFENKDKIKVVHSDAIQYMTQENLKQYDYVNMDIWKSLYDMLNLYLRAICIEAKNPEVKFSYWLENELKCEIQKSMVRVATGINLNNYAFDIIAEYLLENEQIDSIDKFKEVLRLDNFREKMLSFYQNNEGILKGKCTDLTEKVKQYELINCLAQAGSLLQGGF